MGPARPCAATPRAAGSPGPAAGRRARPPGARWVFITGGCSRRGMQWMGVVLYNKLTYIIYITTPCFHCTPLCGM